MREAAEVRDLKQQLELEIKSLRGELEGLKAEVGGGAKRANAQRERLRADGMVQAAGPWGVISENSRGPWMRMNDSIVRRIDVDMD